jgi:hypothetical protein
MRGLLGADLLRMPVRFNGIELGRPIDLLLDREGRRVVGIEVACGDEADRFLPLAAATIGDNEISTGSAFTVIDDADFYRQRGRTLAQVRGRTVEREGVALGALDDVVVAAHGAVVELVLAGGQRIPFDEALTITATPGRTAA